MKNKISVNLQNRSYDILIDENAVENLADFLNANKPSKIVIISDENVAKLHLSRLCEVINKTNIPTIITKVPAGEQTKSFSFFEKTCEEILAQKIDRKSLIIAFGGGVVGDLAGFIAASLLRGINFVQIPTTLLAMVDSSVGGKVAINSRAGKNLVGAFYQPKLVICDLKFLQTLPLRELRAGYAEVVKYGFVFDEKFFEFLEQNFAEIFSLNLEIIQKIVARSCEIKASVVSRDEHEMGERALLNFGHTFGHIFETETNYSNEILHGEAVALGMAMAAKMSENFKLISQKDFLRITSHLENSGFVIDPKKIRPNWNAENLTNHLFKDKKNEGKKLTFILLKKIGEGAIYKDVRLEEFQKVLQDFLKKF